jgi:hypothetical protein
MKCSRCEALAWDVETILATISDLTKEQVAAFKAEDMSEFGRLDKALENAMGVKERAIGAYREHQKTHGVSSLVSV